MADAVPVVAAVAAVAGAGKDTGIHFQRSIADQTPRCASAAGFWFLAAVFFVSSRIRWLPLL